MKLKSRFYFLNLCFSMFFLQVVFAQTPKRVVGTITVHGSPMYEELSPGAAQLFSLPKGKKALVLERKDTWTKIKIAVGKTNSATGWVSSQSIALDDPTMAAPIPASPTISASPNFSEPLAPIAPIVPTVQAQATATPTTSAPLSSNSSKNVSSSFNSGKLFFQGQRNFSVQLKTMAYGLSVDNGGAAAKNVFAFNLPGVGLHLSYEDFFYQPLENIFVGANISYQHGYYKYKLTLQDTSNQTFTTGDSSAMSYHASLWLPAEFRSAKSSLPWLAGLRLGGDYFYFDPKDPQKSTGPLNLFTKTTAINALAGAYGNIGLPWLPGFYATVGLDVSLLGLLKESPGSATGTSPKLGTGYFPRLGLTWQMAKNQTLGLDYDARFQTYTFKGAGSRLATANLTDASQKNTVHSLGLSYVFSMK